MTDNIREWLWRRYLIGDMHEFGAGQIEPAKRALFRDLCRQNDDLYASMTQGERAEITRLMSLDFDEVMEAAELMGPPS